MPEIRRHQDFCNCIRRVVLFKSFRGQLTANLLQPTMGVTVPEFPRNFLYVS